MLTRRSLFLGALFAPAIVRAQSLMPVSSRLLPRAAALYVPFNDGSLPIISGQYLTAWWDADELAALAAQRRPALRFNEIPPSILRPLPSADGSLRYLAAAPCVVTGLLVDPTDGSAQPVAAAR